MHFNYMGVVSGENNNVHKGESYFRALDHHLEDILTHASVNQHYSNGWEP